MPARVASFPPVVGPAPRVLVLGSMPGVRSRAARQYYAHPQNRFWQVMDMLCGAGPRLAYAARLARLRAAGIALWDVLAECERDGSLDATIARGSERANDVAGLLRRHASIRVVAFNGAKARSSFARHVLPALPSPVLARIESVALPSTSPANASIPWPEKLARWRALAPRLEAPRRHR
jgi:hypoxanthine-DNA glycosylase